MPGDACVDAHSDGDVAAHALTDAVLGAAASATSASCSRTPTPPTPAATRSRCSASPAERVRAAGWRVANADVAVVAERHKVGPHRAAMRERLAGALACRRTRCS
jgi:2-C-methyl-D-erythritol 2,4-cyclodiphosphate synthase